MSELDSLYSDSDWLDISSGRESDDNVSLSDQDSDRDEISSVPHSRRSSFSTESSFGGDVEAWEGFVSDSGEEPIDALTGMYPVPLSTSLGTEPIVSGFIPNVTEVIDPFVAEEDKRVKEALDQSFVGTLIASRSSAAGHNSSTHTSIRDLRLSFPDPLSRDDLNGSYQDVPSPVTSNVVPHAVDVEPPAFESSSPPLGDQGSSPTPQVQRNENDPDAGIALDIVLYGTSSSIKWQFVQNLIQKAISVSGYESVNTLEDGRPVQSLQFIKRSNDDLSFYESINVLDRTSEDSLKVETDHCAVSAHRSLAIIYLPTAELPPLSLHDAFLPVLVPSSPELECDISVIRQAAEDDWDLLGVAATSTLQLGNDKSSVIDSGSITNVKPLRVYELLSNIGDEPKKCNPPHKPLTEKIKSVNAVTFFGVISVVMGFALNTMFQPPAPSPTPTVNTPSSSNRIWQALSPQPNRSGVESSTGFNQGKDNSISSFEQLALSFYDSRSAAISATSPSSISLIVPSTSKALSDSASCSESQKPSTDVAIRSSAVSLSKVTETITSLSTISSSNSVAAIASAFPSSATLKFGKDAIFEPMVPDHLKSISEAFDATAKVLTDALGSDFADVVDAADDLLTSFIEHTDSVIQQSKGKARALGQQIQNLNEEVVFRNKRARKRAKELKRKGGDIVRAATGELKERTKRAKERARELKQTVVDNRNDVLRVCAKKHKACERVFGKGTKHEEHEQRKCSRVKFKGARPKNCRHSTGMRWAEYRARRFHF